MSYICILCNNPIDEDEEHLIAEEHGPFGLFEGEEMGRVHMECHDSIYEEDEDDE